MSTSRCILHLSSKKNADREGDIRAFDKSHWESTKTADKKRRLFSVNSKYFKIKLPSDYDENMGFHMKCYKNFIAVPKTAGDSKNMAEVQKHPTLRSNVTHTSTSTSGVFKDLCIFCDLHRKVRNGVTEYPGKCETDKGETTIKAAARQLEDQKILSRVSGIDMKSKEAKYHHSCRRDFVHKAEESRDKSDKMINHEKAFNELKIYIQEEIIDSSGSELLPVIHEKYMAILGPSTYSAQSLCSKILREYGNQIKKHTISKTKGTILYSAKLSVDEATKLALIDQSSLFQTAVSLRRQILKMKESVLEEINGFSQEALEKDREKVPKDLETFFRVLYTGKAICPGHDKSDRLVKSVCDDVIYNTTGGKVKPMKHILMGLGMKSITGSRKVVEILNRYGHSISYHLAEERETEIATEIIERSFVTPDGIERKSGKCTSLAWDNYDELNQTLSGKNTLHDTVGICYQNLSTLEDVSQADLEPQNTEMSKATPQMPAPTSHRSGNVSKRTLQFKDKVLEPYKKKPRIRVFQYNVKYLPPPPDITRIRYLDHLWVLSTLVTKVPMWVGWNSRLSTDSLPQHTIAYMENITLPPTRLDVVVETMRISQKVAEECGQKCTVVHYDLAIAKPALQIQAEQTPKYDNLFICFGPFHILLAYFGALGYYLDGSGGEEILVEADVLAGGSLQGFLKGKHYNRCKRIHPILAAAVQTLHFKQFLQEKGPIPPTVVEIINELNDNASPETLDKLEKDEVYITFMREYEQYAVQTLDGTHGSTAKYWMIYVQLVNLYLVFNRACRTNDLDLFIYALGEMCQHFFAGNRPNYARYMVRYYLNLLNIDASLPEARQMLESGALSVRRTGKSFSRTAVDMTLEQTVNKDAASRLTGISSFALSPATRMKWTVTKTARSAIVGCLLSGAGLLQPEDVTSELKPQRVEKDNKDLQRLVTQICECMNPFDIPAESALYCLTTGKAVPENVKQDLIEWNEKGKEWLEDFQEGCFADPERFEKPIKRRKIKNFASAAVKLRIPSKDSKIKELEGTRDLFGNLLYLSSKENLDLEKVFEYPLTPVPLSLGSVDGSMNATNKSILQQKIEEIAGSKSEPERNDITLVDASFFLYQLMNPPLTYGEIAMDLLLRLCRMSPTVHFITDQYDGPTIKDSTRAKRGQDENHSSTPVQITGPKQQRPKDWRSTIKSGAFKTLFIKFLLKEWAQESYLPILNGHIIYLTTHDECFRFSVGEQGVIRERVRELGCTHPEADTRIVFHLTHCLGHDPQAEVTVRANDTDVFILLLYHVQNFYKTHSVLPHVWLDAGVSSNNSRRCINIADTMGNLDDDVISALPGLHAITGSDTPAFNHKGKVRPLNLMMKDKSHTQTLSKLGEDSVNLTDLTTDLEPWVCSMYGKPKCKTVNKARLAIFEAKYAPKNKGDLLQLVKGANPSNFPPSQAALAKQVQRAHLVASMWKRAWHPNPLRLDPVKHGWTLDDDGHYDMNWFDCSQFPKSVQDILVKTPLEMVEEVDEEEEMSYGENRYGQDESDGNDDTE